MSRLWDYLSDIPNRAVLKPHDKTCTSLPKSHVRAKPLLVVNFLCLNKIYLPFSSTNRSRLNVHGFIYVADHPLKRKLNTIYTSIFTTLQNFYHRLNAELLCSVTPLLFTTHCEPFSQLRFEPLYFESNVSGEGDRMVAIVPHFLQLSRRHRLSSALPSL